MFGPAAAYARDVLDAVERVRPDAIAVDCMPFGAIVGAEKSGLPAAILVHFPIHGPVQGATPFGLGLRPARGPLAGSGTACSSPPADACSRSVSRPSMRHDGSSG